MGISKRHSYKNQFNNTNPKKINIGNNHIDTESNNFYISPNPLRIPIAINTKLITIPAITLMTAPLTSLITKSVVSLAKLFRFCSSAFFWLLKIYAKYVGIDTSSPTLFTQYINTYCFGINIFCKNGCYQFNKIHFIYPKVFFLIALNLFLRCCYICVCKLLNGDWLITDCHPYYLSSYTSPKLCESFFDGGGQY